jgi:predicted PurR-regulated permease PerM
MMVMLPVNSPLRIILTSVALATLAVIFLFIGWQIAELLLLSFAGVLLGVLLMALTDLVSRCTPMSRGPSLLMVMVIGAAVVGGGTWLLGTRVVDEAEAMVKLLPDGVQQARQWLQQFAWGKELFRLLHNLRTDSHTLQGSTLLGGASGIVYSGLDIALKGILVVFLGVYLAVNPLLYKNGILRLVPFGRRDRAREVLEQSDRTLRSWLAGEAVIMLVVGTLQGVGLWLLGVPLALTLGVLAGALEFIPNLGPVTAGTLATLVALTKSPTLAGHVIVFMLVLQAIEGNVLQPLVQKFAVDLPPVLTLLCQVVAATLFGLPGLLVATPLAAAGRDWVRMLYVEDVLGDHLAKKEGD